MNEPVYVTRSSLPPFEEYIALLRETFESHTLTNQGPHTVNLEAKLASYLDSPVLLATANGTLALQLAIRHLGLAGKKVITTPFTYVATTSALLWEGCEPVFADIDPHTLCIDPQKVAEQLEKHPDVAGILPVHVFGNAADVEAIAAVAGDLPVLYDAAHAFGSKLAGKSLFAYGNASIGSFHSTKLFHTVEGGCIATQRPEDRDNLQLLRAFGHVGDEYSKVGINAKMSEMHAAMGLCMLPYVEELIRQRQRKTSLYDKLLELESNEKMAGIRLASGLEWNHAYYPVIFKSEDALKRIIASLARDNIHPRRYFYPCLTRLPYIKAQDCPIAESISSRILCLPLWPDMEDRIVEKIAGIVKEEA